MNQKVLAEFSDNVHRQLFGHLMPFWCGPAVDNEQGGWMAWLSNDLKPDRSQPKGLIVNARILWAFSAVHRAKPDALYRKMADRAFDYVMNRFWDSQNGGAFWRLNDAGQRIDDSKKIYGQAFYIYALTEYHQAFDSPPALARAKELFELIEKHAHDAKFGGYIEVCRRDWSEAGTEARLSDKDMNEKKSMNNHLHVLEAYTNLYRVWKEPRVAERLRELINLFLQKILDPRTLHLHHFFNEQWEVRSDTYTFGHDIEATWLLCEAAEVLDAAGSHRRKEVDEPQHEEGPPPYVGGYGDDALLKQVQSVTVRMSDVVLKEAIATDGALQYEGRAGTIIDGGKECWPQAEAVIGFINAYQLTKDEKYLNAVLRVWDFIENNLVDRVHGEWFWRIKPEGGVDQTLPKVSEWKGPYHASRACLETMHRLHGISN